MARYNLINETALSYKHRTTFSLANIEAAVPKTRTKNFQEGL